MERRLAAIFAADVADYSRLMEEDEAGTLERLKTVHKEVVQPKITAHGGRVVKLMGDGLLAEFPSAIKGVSCAIDIQRTMAADDGQEPGIQPIELRIGVNLGDVIIEGSDIFGDSVNVAARLESLADRGGVCISGSVFDTVEGKIDAAFDDIGLQQVKNIAKPVRAYRLEAGPAKTPQSTGALARSDKPSIAVLPFANLNTDPEQDFLSDGVTEDIITELSRFSELFVIARNSCFTYKGQSVDIRRVARELGVRYILEGSLRRSGTRLRITAQLLDSDGGGHVWGEKFDCDVGEIYDLQDQIVRNVVASIAPQIELAELERGRKLSSAGLSAYEMALKAQALTYDATRAASPEILDRAQAAADAALALDPRNTHALWTKSLIFMYRHMYRWGDDPEAELTYFTETANNLVRIDSLNARSYMLRAFAFMYQRQFGAALADHRRALELNPNLATNLFAMAWTEAIVGLSADAREHVQLALRLSPRETDIWLGEGYAALAVASFTEGDFAEAMKWGHLADQLQPVFQAVMAAANAHLGDEGTARYYVQNLSTFAPEFLPAVVSGRIEVFKSPEHNKLLVDGLRRVGL